MAAYLESATVSSPSERAACYQALCDDVWTSYAALCERGAEPLCTERLRVYALHATRSLSVELLEAVCEIDIYAELGQPRPIGRDLHGRALYLDGTRPPRLTARDLDPFRLRATDRVVADLAARCIVTGA